MADECKNQRQDQADDANLNPAAGSKAHEWD
jgi:hypothetical protein